MTKKASFLVLPTVLACLSVSGCQMVENESFNNQYHSHKNAIAIDAQQNAMNRPSLILKDPSKDTSDTQVLYNPGSKDVYDSPTVTISEFPEDTELTMSITESSVESIFPHQNPRIDTLVGRKAKEIYKEHLSLLKVINKQDTATSQLQIKGDQAAGDYYSLLAVVNAYLQSGTTPGNPELVEMWNNAGVHLELLAKNAKDLGELSNDIAQTASKASFLQDATQATFGLSGAIEEDHENLTALEDQINQSVVRINRMLNVITDEINRRNAYLRSERLNMQTMSLAIANGELYGKSMSSRLFNRVTDAQDGFASSNGFQAPPPTPEKRPMVIIRFDRPNIQYQQPLYSALNQALEKYPAAQFDIIAVSPQTENPAEMALATASARRNSEDVLRSMTQMGVPSDRIQMGSANTPNIRGNEVHLYIR